VRRSGDSEDGAETVTLDGVTLQGKGIQLVDDGAEHAVVVTLSRSELTSSQ
jgi:hypothetical protein